MMPRLEMRLFLASLLLSSACKDVILLEMTDAPMVAHALQLLVSERPAGGQPFGHSYSPPTSTIELRLSRPIIGSLHLGAIVWAAEGRPFLGLPDPLVPPFPERLSIRLKALSEIDCRPISVPFLTTIELATAPIGTGEAAEPLWTCPGGPAAPIWGQAETKIKLKGFGFQPDTPLYVDGEVRPVPFSSLGSAEVELECPALRPGRIELALADTRATLRCPARNLAFVAQSLPVLANGPRPLVAADLDGDGRQDLVAASTRAPLLTVLHRNASGGIQASHCVLSDIPTALSIRDAMIVVATKGGIETHSLNQGTCQERQPSISIPNSNLGALVGVGADFIGMDQLGKRLLRFTADEKDQLRLQPDPIDLPSDWNPLAMVTLSNDADAELAIIPVNQARLAWVRHGTIEQVDLQGCTPQALSPRPAGKGVYVACSTKAPAETKVKEVILGSGVTNEFSVPAQSSVRGTNVTSLVAADLDGDERPELALAWRDDQLGDTYVTVQRTMPVPVDLEKRFFSIRTGHGPSSLAVVDWNGDGQLDLAVSQQEYDNVVLLTNVSY